MAYVGNPLVSTNVPIDTFVNGGQSFMLSRTPASANSILVMIGNVVQRPGSAYFVSGATLTLDESILSVANGGPTLQVLHLAIAGVAAVPSDGSVTPAKLSAGGPSWDGSGNQNSISYLATGAGSALQNALRVQSNGNGLFAPATNAVGISTNSIERIRVASDGSVSRVIPGGSVLYPSFACRAWVNFHGGNLAIRSSGNVSSITRVATGVYQVNMSTPMPDVNYSIHPTTSDDNAASTISYEVGANLETRNTSSFRIATVSSGTVDRTNVNAALFR